MLILRAGNATSSSLGESKVDTILREARAGWWLTPPLARSELPSPSPTAEPAGSFLQRSNDTSQRSPSSSSHPRAVSVDPSAIDIGALRQDLSVPSAAPPDKAEAAVRTPTETTTTGAWILGSRRSSRITSDKVLSSQSVSGVTLRDVYTYTQRHLLRIYPAAWKVDSRWVHDCAEDISAQLTQHLPYVVGR